jgi:uncharacterized protein (DUF1697 family)
MARDTTHKEPVRYVALLRGINVGGHKLISKDTLIESFMAAGLQDVRTYIQSGNVLFNSDSTNRKQLVTKIQKALLEATGHEVTIMLRTSAEIEALVKADPFGKRKTETNANTYVAFLSDKPDAKGSKILIERQTDRDLMEVHETETVHLVFKKPGERMPKSVMDFIGKDLGVDATVRNWNTVTKLAAM